MTTSYRLCVFVTITDYKQDLSNEFNQIDEIMEEARRKIIEISAVKECEIYNPVEEERGAN